MSHDDCEVDKRCCCSLVLHHEYRCPGTCSESVATGGAGLDTVLRFFSVSLKRSE